MNPRHIRNVIFFAVLVKNQRLVFKVSPMFEILRIRKDMCYLIPQ